ncbi:MAG: DUF438 domain-containing protein [Candidatus Zixiibacteriota bacterium]|nr:MAG: DUF438 domain-containing protein [candidate division Zixibacteria bacterium]
MEKVRNIDVRGLDHAAREQRLFPALADLRVGESARLIAEFNPVPLVIMLKSGGEFEVAYEQEGPAEWILAVRRTALPEPQQDEIRRLLEELCQEEVSPQTKEKARRFFETVDAKTLGDMEQELIREGVSHDEIRQSLCDIHLEVLRDSLAANRMDVAPPHPVHTLMEEHKVILRTLDGLRGLVAELRLLQSLDELYQHGVVQELTGLAHHLVEAESHHAREEEALFPMLERHDVIEPPAIMRMDHVEFRRRKQELLRMAQDWKQYDFTEFRERVIELGEFLSRELSNHIFKEDNILYQIALQVLSEVEWREVKMECDRIGYCCFTPAGHDAAPSAVELDLRSLPPYQRHEVIMDTWHALSAGQALLLVNDHDPRPLRYQFEAEYPGRHTWEYEQSGPRNWAVKITKVM